MSSDTVFGVPVYCSIRVVVVGDHGIGKSSLIAAAALENFPESVSPVLPATHSSRLLLSGGRKNKQILQDSVRTTSAVDLEEFCEKHYEKLIPIMQISTSYWKRKKEKLEEVKARLDFGDARKKSTRAQESAYSESRTISPRRQRRSRSPRCNPSLFTRLRCERSRSPWHEYKKKERGESTVFKRLGSRGRSTSAHSDSRQESSRYTENYSESEDSEGGHWKSKLRRKKSSVEDDDLSQPWAAAKTERWAMPTWCHMFNSTLTGNARVWFDDLPPESIDSYDDLREAFLKNYLQQKKCIRDPIVLHNIKQRDGESTEDFIQRYKSESGNVKGAPECMRISGFVHGITNPELIKRFHEKIPKTVDEMMQVATSFLQGQEAALNQERKKTLPTWKHQEGSHRQDFKKGGSFRIQRKQEKRPDRFTLLTKTPREILALEKGKFKTPPPMTTPVEKRNANKFCEFHGEVGHNTDECNHLRKQIEDMLKAGKLSHLIKELKQNSGKDLQKKKGEPQGKEKPQTILMIQPWQKAVRQKITQSFSPDLEISFPSLGNDEGAEGPLIIEAEIGGHQVHRMCIDGGSSFEILYEHCFNRLRPEIRNQMVPAATSLVGFSGEIKWPLGQITLLVKVGDDEHSTSTWMDFMVVRSTSPFNGIIGRPGLRKMKAVSSTTHEMIKFLVMGGTLTLRSSKIIPIECVMISGPEDQPPPVNKVKEERIKVAINPEHPEQTRSLDIFAWTPTDMTGVPRQIAEHRLNVRKGCQPVRQKKRGQAAERNVAINDEVSKLVTAGIMREVHYHDWLSNPVMVKKSDNSWRMCVDFKDLNKACPKDGYHLPEIDWKVESLCGFSFKCFLDAYKGYHQIQMAEEDEEKTAFITNQGIFCYTKMPFGLRNAGATYQRLVDKTFHGQIGRNLEVYVDDLVIKSRTEDEVVRDIEETFKTLRKINMKLNPKKCTFGVEEGMFLGYQVNTKGIKICPDKVDAVLSLQSPKCLKDVQRLNGKLASLNRFLAKSAEKSLPFFKTLKKCTKKSDFLWTEEAEAAFRQMKEHIAKLPMLTAPEEQEELIVYLAASKEAVSAVLMTEREARQMPIYFVSRALRGPEPNAPSLMEIQAKRSRGYNHETKRPLWLTRDQNPRTLFGVQQWWRGWCFDEDGVKVVWVRRRWLSWCSVRDGGSDDDMEVEVRMWRLLAGYGGRRAAVEGDDGVDVGR
ncbi:reverse transcriptase domain-containing protein [Tanacetum coccineum]|uniref:Reverse transcriptase domain-containing protein n=1 Tax=Tanacetum coccineum TaxID=301880 RepID=A0ABQ5C087_9ASTR